MHIISSLRFIFLGIFFSLFFIACSTQPTQEQIEEQYSLQQAENWNKTDMYYVNPFTPGSYKYFLARQDYPNTYDTWSDKNLLDQTSSSEIAITISLKKQRGLLTVSGKPALDFPVSTGINQYPTPTGHFKILSKDPNHKSNQYGTLYDAEGKVVQYNADMTKETLPEGGRFDGAGMDNYMQISNRGIGMHVGKVKRHTASHGCIRVIRDSCKLIYDKAAIGTPVTIKE